ncbi:MAG: alpha/beta hydrolase family protein [Dyella sp.]|uniref:alpha/beta hydrolase family protein n=1 Tax=Dyella sp. TaxID=1869338 RepID=UPI003F7D0462
MQSIVKCAFFASALCSFASVALAKDKIPVESFARHAFVSTPRLSPDGQYVAVRMDDKDGAHALVIYRISDMSTPVSMLRMPKYEVPANIVWVSSTRLIIEKGSEVGSIEKPMLTGEIIATDMDGKHQDYLYGYNSQYTKRASTRTNDLGWGFVVGRPEPANGHFYMSSRNYDTHNKSFLYDVNAEKNARHLIGEIGVDNMEFMVGADGQAHFAYGRNNDYQYVVYHRSGNAWTKMDSQLLGNTFAPIAPAPDPGHIYAWYDAEGGPSSLVEQGENGGERQKLALPHFGSVDGIEWTAFPHRPFAITLATGVPKATYTLPQSPEAKLHQALSLKFPGDYVHFIDFSEDGGQLLFGVSSDRWPGAYFLIDTHTYKVKKLFDVEPWINPVQMAERRPVRFKASDGTELEAILTLPPGAPEADLPMVLVPHGGPIGVQDSWSYDNDAQFLASRGYLVLQVNFRGSAGRGADFRLAGYRQWGTGIVQDLVDAVKWAIAQDYADPKRICVYGASYGGYAAMMASVRAPGLFKCAVGYAGIYDLAMRYKKGDTQESEIGRNALKAQMGDDPVKLDADSPDKLADKIDVPVLLIHGEDDQRAPFAQFKAMKAALDAAHKPYEFLTKPGEGHGFYSEKNNVELYNTLQAFLEKHIGKGA